jgi:excisionase family DNA binding protein
MDGLITDRLSTANELARMLHVKRRTVILWAHQKKIPSQKMGSRTIRFNMPEVLDALNNGHKTPEQQPGLKKLEG